MHDTEILDVRPISRLFKALADETRLRIVALLSHGELCVCHIQAALGLSQSNVSRHLGILRAAGVVQHRRDGTWVHYSLLHQADADSQRHLEDLAETFAKDPALRRRIATVRKTCGPGGCG
jgi:ArsR family transcriptional regulator